MTLFPAFALTACLLAPPAQAGVEAVIDDHALPGAARFAEAADGLAAAADADCTAASLKGPWNEAFDAYLGIQHLRLGPLEEEGRGLALAFWPDSRGLVQKTVARLVADADPVAEDPEAFPEVSVAGRGFFALERLLYDEAYAGYDPDDYACTLARAVARDIARMASMVETGWKDFAGTLRTAGEAGHRTYLTEKEAAQALFTALMTGLEFDADRRLGAPLGTFDRPRPARAEARRSGRSLRNLVLSLEALRDMAGALAVGPIPGTERAFEAALAEARGLDDPTLGGVAEVQGRFETEIVQQRVRTIRTEAGNEIGLPLGVSQAFNSADGD